MENYSETSALRHLLMNVSHILKKHEEIASITGENFNVFKILKLSTNEVRTHSAFLGELLNPNGCHGMKDTFLKTFIDQQRGKFKAYRDFVKLFENFKSESATASVEEYIGLIDNTNNKGGRIDLVIKDGAGNAIVIENKIYAGDQESQLLRYSNAYPKSPVFYLTIDGKEPSDKSKGKLKNGTDFVCISYKEEICNWLAEAQKQAVSYPLLRETISQYINLIKNLTSQTMNEQIKIELADIIVNNQHTETLKAFFELNKPDVLQSVRSRLISIFIDQLEVLAKDLHLSPIEHEGAFGVSNESDIVFYLKNSKKRYYLSIGFCNCLNMFTFGLGCQEEYINEYKDIICANLTNRLPGYNGYIWISEYNYPYNNWSKLSNPWISILDGSMIKNVEDKFRTILKVIEQLVRERGIQI